MAPSRAHGPQPPDIVRAAYAELVVTDLAESRRFWVDLLGFAVSSDTGDALYLRGQKSLYCLSAKESNSATKKE